MRFPFYCIQLLLFLFFCFKKISHSASEICPSLGYVGQTCLCEGVLVIVSAFKNSSDELRELYISWKSCTEL